MLGDQRLHDGCRPDQNRRLLARCVDDLGFVETHDCFTIAELLEYEAMGLAPHGQGGRVILDGVTRRDGRLPVNLSGGLKSRGHPIGATGGRILANLAREMQRRDARYGLETMCIGGGQGLGMGNEGQTQSDEYMAALEAAQQAAPELPRGLLMDEWQSDWRELTARLECVSIHLNHRLLDEARVAAIPAGPKGDVGERGADAVVDEEKLGDLISGGAGAICQRIRVRDHFPEIARRVQRCKPVH